MYMSSSNGIIFPTKRIGLYLGRTL